jgi:hypothetical protein
MSRIYFLAPDVDITHKIVDELRANSIEEHDIHIVARRGTPLQDLPEASPLQKSDIIPAMERALVIGGTLGLLTGLVAVALPTGLVLGGGAMLASTVAGAGIGAWLGGMVGLNVGNTRLKPYEDAVEKGELLILLDIPENRIDEITMMILRHHPEAEFEGIELILPPAP